MGRKKKFISQEYSAETQGKNMKEGTRRSRALTIFTTSFFGMALLIGVSLITFSIIFFISGVIGTSMMRTLNADGIDVDSVLVNRYADPDRGDIIIVKHYNADGEYDSNHIKRLIAKGGDSVYFRLVDNENLAAAKTITNVSEINRGIRYVIEVNGQVLDNNLYQLDPYLGRNMRNCYYDTLWKYQQSGNPENIPVEFTRGYDLGVVYSRAYYNDAPFRHHYEENGASKPFMQYVNDSARWEMVLPDGYMFYMGDNRGGAGGSFDRPTSDFERMSVDCTHYGPQPISRLVGVESDIIHDKGAIEWFFDKLGYLFTFRWNKL